MVHGGVCLEPLCVLSLADLDFCVKGYADLVLDVLDDASLLIDDKALEHVKHHAVLIETEGVPVHRASTDTGECCVKELGVDEFLCIFFEVAFAALDNLTA